MQNTITLTRETPDEFAGFNQHAWFMKVTADSTINGLESEIFVYHASQDEDPYECNIFECVASVTQMYEIPKTAPVVVSESMGIPFFRSRVLEFFFQNQEEMEDTWLKIQTDVQDLIDNYRAKENLTIQEIVTLS